MKNMACCLLITAGFITWPGSVCSALETPPQMEGKSWAIASSRSGDFSTIDVLDLETAKRILLENNPSLMAAEERVRQAREQVRQARSSFFPWLEGRFSGSRTREPENSFRQTLALTRLFDPQASIRNPEDYYVAGVAANWLLFDGLAREFTFAVARLGEKGSQEAYLDALRLLLSSVATSFYSAQLARENMAIAEADLAFNQRQVEEARARRRVGTGSLSDQLSFEVQVNAARVGVISSERAYETSVAAMAALMGQPDAALPYGMELSRLGAETSQEMVLPEIGPLLQEAMEQRTDVLQANYALKQAQKSVAVARAQFFPTIRLTASYEGERVDTADFESDDFGDMVALSLSYNLFSGGYDLAGWKAAKARRDEAKRNLQNLRLIMASEIQEARAKLKAAQQELRLQRSNAELVQRNRDLVEKEYAAGQASLVRLNEAQRNLIQAQSRLALALVSLRLAWHDLKTSTAQTLEPYRK